MGQVPDKCETDTRQIQDRYWKVQDRHGPACDKYGTGIGPVWDKYKVSDNRGI